MHPSWCPGPWVGTIDQVETVFNCFDFVLGQGGMPGRVCKIVTCMYNNFAPILVVFHSYWRTSTQCGPDTAYDVSQRESILARMLAVSTHPPLILTTGVCPPAKEKSAGGGCFLFQVLMITGYSGPELNVPNSPNYSHWNGWNIAVSSWLSIPFILLHVL